ncbi:MAG: hypothetical protein ACON5F_07025 [Jejuia sp.]
MKNTLIKHLTFLLLPFSLISQNINGKVYDNESTVKGIKVFNVSQKIKTYTDEEGNFIISAKVSDTLFFESLFHEPKYIQLKKINFEDVTVFELKKTLNALGEVLISNEDTERFNPLEYIEIAENAMARDLKRNTHLYIPQSSYSNGMNFIAIAKLIGSLFKRKNKPKPVEYVKFKDLDSLFKNDKLFTLSLLHKDLNIPEEYANLFLDYCENKNLNKTMITEENKVVLLDSMVNFSKEFLKITKEYETSKDSLSLKN